MSQDWKVRNVLIEMHGNNGSIDGDPPAPCVIRKARLSAIASELLKDLDKGNGRVCGKL
ncbi:DNA gyrase subunit A [Bacillus sp. SL00103]